MATSQATVTPNLDPVAAGQAVRIEVAGNALSLYTEAPVLFHAMLADMAAAKSRIWLETYIFANDASGRAIAGALMRRAAEGLDVRVLYDAVGSQATGPELFSDLRGAGVQVHAYHSLWEALRKFSFFTILNRRDHRKLLVIDDVCAYFGGMNIVDHGRDLTFLQTDELQAPTLGWRDLHVRLQGPQQQEIAHSFHRSWLHAKGQYLRRRPKEYRRVKLIPAEESIHFFDSGPGLSFSRAARVYRKLLRRARHQVVIAMAYFIPVRRVLRALLAARRRQVRVHVIVPAKTDVRIAQLATRYLYHKLLRSGIRIYERASRVLHSKVVVIDRQWTILGSANIDPRSLWTNLEFLAVIRSPRFAAAIRRICRYELRHSRRVRLADVEHNTTGEKILNTLAYWLRWWL